MKRELELEKLLDLVNENLRFFENAIKQLQVWKKMLLVELSQNK